jgi:hypothetical protein
MSFVKFSYIFTMLTLSVDAFSFAMPDCLRADYETKIAHKSAPLGLTNTVLAIQKEGCVMTFTHVKYDFLKSRWEIDVCRGPVHIKSGATSVEVLKREGGCPADTDYCKEMENIFGIVQNDGLIFAPGDKEDLKTDHGMFYCGFELLKSYLEKGLVFSKSLPVPPSTPLESPKQSEEQAQPEVNQLDQATEPAKNEKREQVQGSTNPASESKGELFSF